VSALSAERLGPHAERQAERFGTPGGQIALLTPEGVSVLAIGRSRSDLSDRVSPETLFQMGSSTKMLTAALYLHAVDRGLVRLDTRVKDVLPDFRLGDRLAAAQITARHLLTHTGGFDGDYYLDTGCDPGCIGTYVRACADLEQITPPGVRHSYSNAGFAILAHMCEQILEAEWPRLVVEVIARPAGMTHFFPSPSVPLPHTEIAWGHTRTSDGQTIPSPPYEHCCLAPCGGGPVCTSTDLLSFISMLMNGGVAPSGARVLSRQSAAAMLHREIEGPCSTFASAWGLGTMLHDWTGGQTLFGHDGAVPGQTTYLRAHAPTRTAICIMTNGGEADGFADAIVRESFCRMIGADPQASPTVSEARRPLSDYCGVYSTQGARLEVEEQDGGLRLTLAPGRRGLGGVLAMAVDLKPVDDERFLASFPGRTFGLLQRFVEFDESGRASVLNFRGREYRRDPAGEKAA
jgi:CubicO group peptidase (beta-lactamase class C family)